jgi:hypothetical protein
LRPIGGQGCNGWQDGGKMAAMQRKEQLAALPQSWRNILGDFRFQAAKHGMSDTQIFRLRGGCASFASQTLYLKAAPLF